jgi:hypothetical protein
MDSLLALLPIPSGTGTVLVVIAILAVIWIVLKFVLKLAMRVVASGCFVILLLGVILLAFRYVR